MLKFSIFNAFRRKGIAIIAIIGTALGVALMTVLLSISDGMDAMMTSTMNEVAGWIAVYPESAPLGYMMPSQIGFSESYVDEIKKIDNVKADTVSPLIIAFVPTEVADFGDPMGVNLRGSDSGDAVLLGENNPFDESNIVVGRAPYEDSNEVIIGSMLSVFGKAKGGDYAEVGGEIEFPVGSEFVTLKVVGIFETGNHIYDTVIYTDINTARNLMPTLAVGEVNYIHVEATDIKYVQDVASAIEIRFADSDVPVTAKVATDMMESFTEMMDVFHSFL